MPALRLPAAAAVPLIAFALLAAFAVAAFGNGYQVYVLGTFGLLTIVGVGLNVLYGLAGLVSFGHAGFYAVGAYAVGVLLRAGLGLPEALAVAVLVAACLGALLALPALRVTGTYLAMITIAFGFIVENGAVEWRDLTGGASGLADIPPATLLGHAVGERWLVASIVLAAALALAGFARFARSAWGLAMRACDDAEAAARAIGIDPFRLHGAAFVISAALAGLAGGLYTPLNGFLAPSSFPFWLSIQFLAIVIVGGAGSVLGPLLGAAVLTLLPEALAGFADYRLLLFGGLLLAVLWIAPRGLAGLLARRLRRREPAQPAAAPDIEAWLRPSEPRGLDVAGLGIAFGGVRAVSGVEFTAAPGAVTSIIGPNGAGKTTLLNMASGFYRPDAGSIRLGGTVELAGMPSHRVARAGVARTFQTSQPFGSLSVLDNVRLGLRRGRLIRGSSGGGTDEAGIAAALLRFAGHAGALHVPAGGLPHVDRRLLEIARALAMRPAVLLLDEPAAGLDARDTAALGRLLRRIAGLGITVLLVEHDMPLVMGISDHVVVLDAGQRIAAGPPAAVQADPAVRRAYLGEGGGAAPARAPAGPAPPGAPLLEVAGLAAGYGAAPVISGIDIAVPEGRMVAILGANGAGKSTLMQALAGLLRPVEGDILLAGTALQRLDAAEVARRGLVLVPEGRQVFREMSVRDNLRLGAFTRRDVTEAEIDAMLARFPLLQPLAHRPAGLLSGGEQQLLAIGRGLLAKPRVLMLDEPSLGLAPQMVERLFETLAGLRQDGTTILLVDQMAALALAVADHAYVLDGGRIVRQGSAAALAADDSLAEAYLGRSATSEPVA